MVIDRGSQELILELAVKACILVTFAFLLTRTRLFPNLLRPNLTLREQASATFLLLAIGFMEVLVTTLMRSPGSESPMNLRIVAVCVAGLLAGPWVGLFIGAAVTAISLRYTSNQPLPIATSMILAGLIGGLMQRWNAGFAAKPLAGFLLGVGVSLLRNGLVLLWDPQSKQSVANMLTAAPLHGAAVALILLVIEQSRNQEAQARAAAMSEVRALQANMNPHFLFNSLNLLSALSATNPDTVPQAAAHLGRFLRSTIDRHDQTYVSLAEEMAIVDAYLEIETLRFGDRLATGKDLNIDLQQVQVPPFLLQPLVENAILHGIQPKPEGGNIHIQGYELGSDLMLVIKDDGVGMSPETRDRLLKTQDGHLHALQMLTRRLENLYGPRFRIEVKSQPNEGTEITLRLPKRSAVPSKPAFRGTLQLAHD